MSGRRRSRSRRTRRRRYRGAAATDGTEMGTRHATSDRHTDLLARPHFLTPQIMP